MPYEIERKFLVIKAQWHETDKPEPELLRQGYILTDPAKTIRVRQTPDKGFLTIKGKSVGASRTEFEYEIPFEEANELLDQFAVSELSKLRYKVWHEEKLWEIDEFLGDNEGLIIAEIELESEGETFNFPAFIGREVTAEERYYNSNLTLKPFKTWKHGVQE